MHQNWFVIPQKEEQVAKREKTRRWGKKFFPRSSHVVQWGKNARSSTSIQFDFSELDHFSLSLSLAFFNIFDQVPLISILSFASPSSSSLHRRRCVLGESFSFDSLLFSGKEKEEDERERKKKNVAEKEENNGFEFICRSLVGCRED